MQEGSLDVICSGVTVTAERQTFLDFSRPYLSFRLCLVTHKENPITSLSQLKAKSIGLRKATEAELFFKINLAESHAIYSDTNDELYQLLRDKKLDALIDDSPIAGAFVKLNERLQVSFFLPGTESEYAIAIRKSNDHLKNSINDAMTEIMSEKYWQKIYNKWFEEITL